MNILITHVYSSDNKGDAALTSVLIASLVKQFSRPNLGIMTLDWQPRMLHFENVQQYPSFMHFALHKYRRQEIKLLYAVYMMWASLLWAVWLRLTGRRLHLPADLRAVAERYAAADVIVPVGGGYIRSRPGLAHRLNIPLLLHPLLFGYILGKPTILYSQSVGPFVYGYEGKIVGWVLRRMVTVMLREDISVELLARLGVRKNVVRGIDAGFLFTSPCKVDIRKQYGIADDALLLGVTVRSWLSGDAQYAYEKAVARTLDVAIHRHGAHVVFIPQVTAAHGDDDRVASRRVHALMRRQSRATVVDDALDHTTIKAMYSDFDVLLGTRFHSVIFSLTSYVPVVAIEYEHKTSGIMRDLGLDEWVIGIEKVTPSKLINLFEKLMRRKGAYRRQLRKVLPPYIARAEAANDILARFTQ